MLSINRSNLDVVAKKVGDDGDQAVRDHIAPALAKCQIKKLGIRFEYCNLSKASVQLLANAVERNTCLARFECLYNPFSCPNGRPDSYDVSKEEFLKQAIIRSKAPITRWNAIEPLPQDMVAAREKLAEERTAGERQVAERVANLAEVTQALLNLELGQKDAKQCAAALASQGFDSLKKLTKLHESDLADCGITGFSKRVVLELKANLGAAAAAASAPQQPAAPVRSPVHSTATTTAATATPSKELGLSSLPPTAAFYAFLSHNWGENSANHLRVRRIKDWFVQQGAPMWFDDERLTGNVASQITKGMDSSAAVVVFITKAYLEKVDKGADKEETDWCHFEFTYASTKMKRKLIAVVMEEDMLAKSKWSGEVVGYLGKNMHIDYTSDDKFEQCCQQLAKAIADKI